MIDNLDGRRIKMATISKESLAQFWLHVFPHSINSNEYLSFSNSKIVENLLEFSTEKNEEKKIFDMINNSIQQIKPQKIPKTTPSKRRRSNKNIDTNRVRFTVHIEVLEYVDEEIPIAKIEGRIRKITSSE
jgi:hypothetical protein